MRNLLTRMVEQALQDLETEYDITVGLTGFPDVETESASQALENSARYLRRRARDLLDAERALNRISEQFVAETEYVGLTEFGWGELRAEIEGLLRTDPAEGVGLWLDTWCRAMASGRMSAVDRLLEDVKLPEAVGGLGERARAAVEGLRRDNFLLADALLSAASDGMEIAGKTFPERSVRDKLVLTRLRAAIRANAGEDIVAALFERARKSADPLTLSALRARHGRKSGDLPPDETPVFTIEEAANIDAAIELIEMSGRDQSPGYAFTIAQKAIDAIARFRKPLEVIEATLADIPTEIWIAAADRAVSEQNRAAFDHCLDKATYDESTDAYLWARYYLTQAKGFDAFGEPAKKRAEAWRWAGVNFLSTTELDQALKCLEAARKLDPDDIGILMSYGNALSIVHFDSPIEETPAEVSLTLDRFYTAVDAAEEGCDASWCHRTAAGLHDLLGRKSGPDGVAHRWRSFLASGRAAFLDRHDWRSWNSLATSALLLGMQCNDLTYSKHALGLEENVDTLESVARGLYNTAAFDALERLSIAQQTSYFKSIVVLIHYFHGDYGAAISLYEDEKIPPRYSWAAENSVASAVQLQRFGLAVRIARGYRDYWSVRRNEGDHYSALATFHFVSGEFAEGREVLRSNPDASESDLVYLGMFDICLGDTDQGLQTLLNCARKTNETSFATLWTLRSRNWMTTVAEHYGVDLPDFAEVDAAFDERARFLTQDMTALRELEEVEAEAVDVTDRSILASARAFGRVLLALIGANPDAAMADLEGSRQVLSGRDYDLARTCLEDARAPQTDSVDEAESDAPDPPAAGETAAEVSTRITLRVADAWLEGHPDPLRTHDLFRRWIPEARLAQPDLPAILIKAEADYAPGQYEIEIDGAVVDSGLIDEGEQVFDPAAEVLLDVPAEQTETTEAGLVILHGALPQGGLADLLRVTAQNRVIRRVVRQYQSLTRGRLH